MAYCLSSEILELNQDLPQTTTVSNYTATVSLIDSHISRADALINSKIATRYTTPVGATSTSTPPLIKLISQDITTFYTYRTLYSQDNQNRSDHLDDYAITPEAENAFALLASIRSGETDLVNSAGSLVTENLTEIDSQVEGLNEDYASIFDVDSTFSQQVDPDRLGDIADAR